MTALEENETKWYDAWVRWERGSKETYNNDDDDDDEEEGLPVPTKKHFFQYGDVSVELEGFHADSEAIWSSTGLTLWRSSEYLCEYLVSSKDDLLRDDTRILEVGSGLGRCGILASLLNPACRVLATDGDTDALAQLRANVQHNQRVEDGVDSSSSSSLKSNISCHQLLWGEETARTFMNSHGGTFFDVIIGSDLIYVPNVIEPLFKTIKILLSPKDGKFIMAHCARRQGNEVNLDMIFNAAKQIDLKWDLLKQDDDIYLFSFEWNE